MTTSATDGFEDSNVGTASAFAQAIMGEAGLENIVVTDHGDGSLTIRNGSSPYIDGAEVTLAKDQTPRSRTPTPAFLLWAALGLRASNIYGYSW